MTASVKVIDHPLVQHKLSLMRQKERSTSSFRNLLAEISMLLAYEVTRDLPLVGVRQSRRLRILSQRFADDRSGRGGRGSEELASGGSHGQASASTARISALM